jgi:hypothetical protein
VSYLQVRLPWFRPFVPEGEWAAWFLAGRARRSRLQAQPLLSRLPPPPTAPLVEMFLEASARAGARRRFFVYQPHYFRVPDSGEGPDLLRRRLEAGGLEVWGMGDAVPGRSSWKGRTSTSPTRATSPSPGRWPSACVPFSTAWSRTPPVTFVSFEYLLLLLGTFGVYYFLPWRLRITVILVASYVFYAYWEHWYAYLIGFTTVMDYVAARAIHGSGNPRRRRLFLGLSIAANLGLLGYFKYTNFALDTLQALLGGAGLDIPRVDVLLPAGISFIRSRR